MPFQSSIAPCWIRFIPACITAAYLAFPGVGITAAETRDYPPVLEGAREEVYKKVDDVELRLFIFEPSQPAPAPRPAVVFFFGGGWKKGTPKQFEQHCRHLADQGVVGITADYRVSTRHETQAKHCVADGKSAVRWVRQNAQRLNVDPNRIVAAGGSAGGHVAACTGVLSKWDEAGEDQSVSSRPNLMILFNPAVALAAVDGVPPLKADVMKTLPERMGVDPKALSPLHHVAAGVPPTLIFHGKADETVPYRTVEWFGDAMKTAGNSCTVSGFDDAGHGFFNYGRGENRAYHETVKQMDAFLVAHRYIKRPNFIIIFTDDQGYQDLGCFGSPLIKTPNLDRMAAEGMKFTDFYSANSVCSPSRAALLTGCYPTRVSVPGVLFPRHDVGLHPQEITIADVLKEQGYATACIGKWHLGHKPPFLPTKQGFDSYFGIPYSNDMTIDPDALLADDIVLREGVSLEHIKQEKPKKNWVPLMGDQQVVEYPCDQTTLTQRYTDEAVRFLREHQSQPFFLYLPHTMPHIPLFASQKFAGTSKRGLYGDTIEEIDASVGRILGELKSLGLDENTLVVYTSDNGPWKLSNGRGGSADPLRGFKFQTYEGGMRVPCLMRWPGRIPAGAVCSQVAGTIDMLPTLTKLAGAKTPQDRVIDGHDVLPLMEGHEDATSPHEAYFYYRGTTLEAVRVGDWKLRRTQGNRNRNKKKQKKQSAPNPPVELFNLASDISESKNLADEHPEMVKQLITVITDFDSKLKQHVRPAGSLQP